MVKTCQTKVVILKFKVLEPVWIMKLQSNKKNLIDLIKIKNDLNTCNLLHTPNLIMTLRSLKSIINILFHEIWLILSVCMYKKNILIFSK